jgi:site-specific DNA-methyltransferase (adenine-specific)/modification methylase
MRVERIGDATLYLGDCFEILPTLPKVDAVITDPPYGIGFAAQPCMYQRRAGMEAKDWDNKPVDRLPDLLELGEKQVVWGGNHYALPPSRAWLVWYKPDGPQSFSRVELAWTNLDKLAGFFQWSISATNAERVGHPTQKPLAVMRWCIDYAGTPETIFDPFMGSGTTGVACAQLGRKFIGIEIEPKYFDIACRRIEQAYAQGKLFQEPTAKAEQLSL